MFDANFFIGAAFGSLGVIGLFAAWLTYEALTTPVDVDFGFDDPDDDLEREPSHEDDTTWVPTVVDIEDRSK